MRVLMQGGSVRCPALDGETGERFPDFDLLIGLGAHFDPAQNGIGPMTFKKPELRPLGIDVGNPTDTSVAEVTFDFCERELDGQPTLCMVVTATGGAVPLREWPMDDARAEFAYELSQMVTREARKRGRAALDLRETDRT